MDGPVLLWNSNNQPKPRGRNQNISTHSRIIRSASDSQRSVNRNFSTPVDGESNQGDKFRQRSEHHHPRPPSGTKLEQKSSLQSSREKIFEKRQARALSAKLASSAKTVANTLHGNEHRSTENERDRKNYDDDVSTTTYDPANTFVCGACDRMYTTRKDLDIHKAFCYELQT